MDLRNISKLLAAYRAKEFSPADVVAESFSRIAAAGKSPIWISLADREHALERARTVDLQLPLAGVPFAVKDNMDVAGMATTAGCPAYAYTPERSAHVVEQLESAGAILIGKTNLDQFATGLVGTRTPYGACSSIFGDEYISGGSSSGSAIATAKGQVAFALGTDTAGSGRVPAAFNNLVGLKPTRGLISARGVVPACQTLDCVSIFTHRAPDAALVLDAAQGFDPADPYSRPTQVAASPWLASRTRVGVLPADQREFFGDTEAAKLYAESIENLRKRAEIVEIDYTPFRDVARLLYSGPWVAERLAAIQSFYEQHAADMDPTVAKIIGGAKTLTATDGFRAQYQLEKLRRVCAEEWKKMDVLLLPTAATHYRHDEVAANPIQLNSNLGYYTNFVNLLDLSALAIPAGFRTNGLPFGVTLIGRAFEDRALLAFADDRHAPVPGCVSVAVVGAHLTGQPLNHQLTSRGARLISTTKTSARYRLYALSSTTPAKPGLQHDPSFAGAGIEVEVWAVPEEAFGGFVAEVPPPLGIGSIHLADGSTVKGFVCEPFALRGAQEITAHGGWRNWLAAK